MFQFLTDQETDEKLPDKLTMMRNMARLRGEEILTFLAPGSDRIPHLTELLDYPILWVAYHYKYDSAGLSGYGLLLAALIDGSYVIHDVSHCSCFGPVSHFELSNSLRVKYTVEMIRDMHGKNFQGASASGYMAKFWEAVDIADYHGFLT